MNILDAHNQWSTRPADERFWGINDALETARFIKENSYEIPEVPHTSLKVRARNGEVLLTAGNNEYHLSHSAAQQICARARVPHSFVSRQPALLAAQNINWGLETAGVSEGKSDLFVYRGEQRLARAITSERYVRYFNCDYLAFLKGALNESWRVPPARPSGLDHDPRTRPATAEDVRGIEGITSIRIGDEIAPAGVYLSDRDMFVFVVNFNRSIQGPSGPLARFALFWNNEVGTGSWGFTLGYFDHVCGNHIIWGAQGVREYRFRHVGNHTASNVREVRGELVASNSGMSEDEQLLKVASTKQLGSGKDEVVENIVAYGRKCRINELTEARVTKGYQRAIDAGRYGNPNTAWSVVSGLTELSQETKWGSERIALDRASARILEMVG